MKFQFIARIKFHNFGSINIYICVLDDQCIDTPMYIQVSIANNGNYM